MHTLLSLWLYRYAGRKQAVLIMHKAARAFGALQTQFCLFSGSTYRVCKIIRSKAVTTVIRGGRGFHGNQLHISEFLYILPAEVLSLQMEMSTVKWDADRRCQRKTSLLSSVRPNSARWMGPTRGRKRCQCCQIAFRLLTNAEEQASLCRKLPRHFSL